MTTKEAAAILGVTKVVTIGRGRQSHIANGDRTLCGRAWTDEWPEYTAVTCWRCNPPSFKIKWADR